MLISGGPISGLPIAGVMVPAWVPFVRKPCPPQPEAEPAPGGRRFCADIFAIVGPSPWQPFASRLREPLAEVRPDWRSRSAVAAIFPGSMTYITTSQWVCPPDVLSVDVALIAGGAGGSGGDRDPVASGGAGGGGGAYSNRSSITVTPYTSYTVTVGAGGTGGTLGSGGVAGGDSWFGSISTVLAKGGSAFAGGSSNLGVGDIRFSGGRMGNGNGALGGGGGGSASPTGNGNAGSDASAGGAGGSAISGGGAGGSGSTSFGVATGGTIPGGGGGGGFDIVGPFTTGGSGARGYVTITYNATPTVASYFPATSKFREPIPEPEVPPAPRKLAGWLNVGYTAPSTWQPFARKFREPLPDAEVPPAPRKLAGWLNLGYTAPSAWQPFARKFREPISEPEAPPSRRILPPASIAGSTRTPWFPVCVRNLTEDYARLARGEEVKPASGRNTVPWLYTNDPGLHLLLIPWDDRAGTRSRRHQQLVSKILNSLITEKQLLIRDSEDWSLGYVPGNHQNWAPGRPTTVNEALDRIAALLKSLTGGTGP